MELQGHFTVRYVDGEHVDRNDGSRLTLHPFGALVEPPAGLEGDTLVIPWWRIMDIVRSPN
jgi:hypothetical protein